MQSWNAWPQGLNLASARSLLSDSFALPRTKRFRLVGFVYSVPSQTCLMGDTTDGCWGLGDESDLWPLAVEVGLAEAVFISTSPAPVAFSLLGNLPEDNLESSCVLLLCREHQNIVCP